VLQKSPLEKFDTAGDSILLKNRTAVACSPQVSDGVDIMKKFKFLVALTTRDNDYQQEQEIAAQEKARRLGVDVKIIDANNDPIGQSQQLLRCIQSTTERPDGIIVEPIGGTALPIVARAASQAGIGWVVLNREIDYVGEIRKAYNVPAFCITSNHDEIGRIQGRQLTALLPKGGSVLYIEGPSTSSAARLRTAGMYETKAANIQIRTLRGDWTMGSGQHTVEAWLRLSTSVRTHIDLVASQNDAMAMGARKAFQELPNAIDSRRWLNLPYTGVDGLPKNGQKWVREGLLAATVVVPTNTGLAIEMLVKALESNVPPREHTSTAANSFPSFETLATRKVLALPEPSYAGLVESAAGK
jgi:ribose transport system substrate-binding protein